MRLLAGDVGGTKTWLATYDVGDGGKVDLVRRERIPSGDYPSLSALVSAYLKGGDGPVDRAAFGVAGPVVDDRSQATNLPWQIDARGLEHELRIPRVRLLNDFHAVALGIAELGPDDVEVLREGATDPEGPVEIVGAGTGLGEAVLLPGSRVLPSEGGHVDFAPRDELEIDLLRFLLGRHERVSVERVVSGPGLKNIYEFVVARGLAETGDAVKSRISAGDDVPAVIGEAALDGSDPACVRSAELFLSLYGAEVGNFALKVLPAGGIYVAGGIAPRLLPILRKGAFVESFLDKGRMRPLLESFRLAVVLDTRVGLLGARAAAARL